MNDYMRALHQRFCKEPECKEVLYVYLLVYATVKERLPRQDQEKLLRIADLEIDLREETSLAILRRRVSVGMGIAGEMERYCFEDEEEKRATERAKMRCLQVKI